jgi:hypothetical protein
MTIAPAPSVSTPLIPYQQPAATTQSPVSFGDLLDAINPLQHIPVVSSLYRGLTGGAISTGSQIAGDLLYGAALGGGVAATASTLANGAVKLATGKDILQHAIDEAGALTTASTNHAGQTTPLTPDPAGVSPSPSPPVDFVQAERQKALANGQYQRAEAFGALNKHLVAMNTSQKTVSSLF